MMTVGKIITNDDLFKGVVSDDNVVRHLNKAGKTWKVYAEDLPSVGYHSPHDNGDYVAHHNPLAYFSDVVSDSMNLVPFTHFASDLAVNRFANYVFIAPNVCNDAHSCPVATADTWIKTNIEPLIKSTQFQKDGLLILLFDESATDRTHGGGRVVCILIGSKVKAGFKSTTVYQHESVLRLTAKVLGLAGYPNAAAGAPDMDEFFKP
jgi:acid phosphatase